MTYVPMQPPLSLAERDRRWARVRSLMRERSFDGLLVAGFRSREMYETYISDDYNEGCVIFPLEGDPVVITWAHLRVMRARWSQERGTKLWVDDYRVATNGTAVAEVLREKRLSSLGVVGLSSQAPTEIYGAIPANFWMELTAALPKARWEDISEEFSHLMLVKSDEELAQVRYAARAPEAGCRMLVEVATPGIGEEVVFAEATKEMLRHGIGLAQAVNGRKAVRLFDPALRRRGRMIIDLDSWEAGTSLEVAARIRQLVEIGRALGRAVKQPVTIAVHRPPLSAGVGWVRLLTSSQSGGFRMLSETEPPRHRW